jgi:DNA uptake protein ComE-like DNA-binding protein
MKRASGYLRIAPQHRRRRGAIFVTALGITVVLSGLALVFAQAMRTEATASANRLSAIQADTIELAAEQWVMAYTDDYTTDAVDLTEVPAQGIQVGTGYFWIIRNNQTTDQTWDFGIEDEAGKLNINTATPTQLENLPDMTSDIADSIVAWRGGPAGDDGATTDYYQALTEPYAIKGANFESPEELLLVDGVTSQLLWGEDLNRNGVIDANEQNAGGNMTFSTGDTISDTRGIFPFITCFTTIPPARGGAVARAQVNINTASEGTLMCLGISQDAADSIITAREGTPFTSVSPQQLSGTYGIAPNIAALLTTTSNQYSADIVAVSGDGRAFKRVRIVVDCTKSPCSVVYRRDLTAWGWPLPQQTETQLRSGQGISTDNPTPGYDATGSTGMTGL